MLFICSSPEDKNPIGFGKAFRTIKEARKSASKRDEFEEIKIEPAFIFNNLIWRLSSEELQPNFIHIAMHASKDKKGLYFEDEHGGEDLITAADFGEAIKLYSELYQIDYMVLSACNSIDHAEAVLPFVKYVVGTNDIITDPAAILYAKVLYRFIFDGKDFEYAHSNALLTLKREAKKEIKENITIHERIYTYFGQEQSIEEVFKLLKNKNR